MKPKDVHRKEREIETHENEPERKPCQVISESIRPVSSATSNESTREWGTPNLRSKHNASARR